MSSRLPPPPVQFQPRLALALALTISLDVAGQLVWKLLATRLPDTSVPWTVLHAAGAQPLAWLMLVLLLVQLALWRAVLKRSELSFVQPITALSYVGVALVSVLCLGESFSWRQGLSIACILLGVALVSASGTQGPDEEPRVT